MKSKAHMKKCLELGVSVTSVEDADAEEAGMNQTDLLSIFYTDEPIFDKYWALYVALVRFLRNNYCNEKQEPPLSGLCKMTNFKDTQFTFSLLVSHHLA